MTALDRLDRIGGHLLIYEGAVLALRRVPGAPSFPAISDCIWALPRRHRWVAALPILGYLLHHFIAGPRSALRA